MTRHQRPLRAVREDYLTCRALRGHAWEPIVAFDMRKPMFGVRLSLRCTRCTTERHTLYSRDTGEQLSRHDYRRPDGYSDLPGRSQGMALADYRVELLNRRPKKGKT